MASFEGDRHYTEYRARLNHFKMSFEGACKIIEACIETGEPVKIYPEHAKALAEALRIMSKDKKNG